VGHALGLRHNFKGSMDAAHHRPGEFSTSVMDYLADLTTPATPGAYDEAALLYGYAGRPADVMGALAYGTDEHQGVDPDCNPFDDGDPLAFYVEELRSLRRQGGTGVEAFTKDVLATLTRLRCFVNNSSPERSAKALDTLLTSLTRKGHGAKSKAERQAAHSVLTADAPAPGPDDEDPPPPYKPLNASQRARVTTDSVDSELEQDGHVQAGEPLPSE
jgi:hypothetical protein